MQTRYAKLLFWPFSTLLALLPILNSGTVVAQTVFQTQHIVVGEPSVGIRVYSVTGQLVASFGSVDTFMPGSRLAAGDFDGDGTDEIVVGTPGDNIFPPNGFISIYNLAGQRVGGFSNVFGHGYSLKAGDVDGNGVDEIVIGAPGPGGSVIPPEGNVVFYDRNGQSKGQLSNSFGPGYVLAVGDVDGNGVGEIVIGNPGIGGPSNGFVSIYDWTGAAKGGFDVTGGTAFGPNFGLAVSSTSLILIGNPDTKRVVVTNRSGMFLGHLIDLTFEVGAGLAVGDILGVVGNPFGFFQSGPVPSGSVTTAPLCPLSLQAGFHLVLSTTSRSLDPAGEIAMATGCSTVGSRMDSTPT
jgi:hypothetical protein